MASSVHSDFILRSALSAKEPLRVDGLTSPSVAYLATKIAAAANRLICVVCPNDDSAQTIASDILAFQSDFPSNLPPLVFPGWEHSPYSAILPSIQSRTCRAAALHLIAAGSSPRILVTSIQGAQRYTATPQYLLDATTEIRLGQTLSDIQTRLIMAGYLRVEPVEDPGTFSVRGDILDIFPPHLERPVRVELFGDTVEKIRYFDPDTQRTDGTTLPDTVRIPPAREVLLTPETCMRIRSSIKAMGDEFGIPRSTRDPLMASVLPGSYSMGSEAWAKFAYENVATLWDFLPEESLVLYWDELSCKQEMDRLHQDLLNEFPSTSSRGMIGPHPDQLLDFSMSGPERSSLRKVYFDRFAISRPNLTNDESASSAHVSIKPNTDLKSTEPKHSDKLAELFSHWIQQNWRILLLSSTETQLERTKRLLLDQSVETRLIDFRVGSVSEGFRWPAEELVVLNDSEVFGRSGVSGNRLSNTTGSSNARKWSGLQDLADLSLDDLIVHFNHGIGVYRGLVRMDISGAPSDFLLIEYAGADKLYLPVDRLNLIQKHMGSQGSTPLDRLGSLGFEKAKAKVKESVKKLAFDLVQLYAQRSIEAGFRCHHGDSSFLEFEARFPFQETPDQSKAIQETLSDLQSGKIMDRVICGDVGFGKTEVAIRAAFLAVSSGKQVIVLVPTTILAYQHERSFLSRLSGYPVVIESLSRFKGKKEQADILSRVKNGKVDILIGTHRLLSRDIDMNNLGLVIIDEEHRFGVEHKEKLKTLRTSVHVLTLTATPIPRTLHLSLSGLREISLITTPPVNRLPIRTYVSIFEEDLVRRALDFEISRGGQVFFLHNRVNSINKMAETLLKIRPGTKILVAHGQMPESELERVMLEFYDKKADVLLCTTIIESGLDIPNANTILINQADHLGLAQLYQLRGRVGRSNVRAYAYLLVDSEKSLTEDAKKRLEVIQRFVELGSGFSIASHDLEIRGGGNLLGPQQSGHIAAVGFDLYTELLEEAIREVQGKPPEVSSHLREPEIKIPFPSFVDESYVPDIHQRLSLYRRLSSARNEDMLRSIEEEMLDRYGPTPAECSNLLWILRLKFVLRAAGVDALTAGPSRTSLTHGADCRIDPHLAVKFVSESPHQATFSSDGRLILLGEHHSAKDLFFTVEGVLKKLCPQFNLST